MSLKNINFTLAWFQTFAKCWMLAADCDVRMERIGTDSHSAGIESPMVVRSLWCRGRPAVAGAGGGLLCVERR